MKERLEPGLRKVSLLFDARNAFPSTAALQALALERMVVFMRSN